MALFPFFMNIEGAQGLIVGGGKHALEKIERLRPYGPKLRVIAAEFRDEILANPELTLIRRPFEDGDLNPAPAFVIVAGDDVEENRRISALCKERHILVNVVDDQEYCDFIFPSLISCGNLSIGICTNGASPSTGVLLKRKIQSQIPENMEEILDFLQSKRPEIMEEFPNKKQRFAFYYKLSELCMEEDRVLSEEEFQQLIVQEKMV